MNNLPDRIARLRDELFATKTQTCFERAIAITESYKATVGESMPIRRAKALSNVLCNTPIYIRDDELLVGSRSSRLGWRTSYPEYSRNVDGVWPEDVDEYWEGKTIGELSKKLTPTPVRLADAELAACYVTGTDTGFGHLIVDYDKAISKGLRAVIEDAEKSCTYGDLEAQNFCKSVVIACESVITWANRYSDLAVGLAKKTSDSVRRSELEHIAKICRRVPEYPARNFHEALQSFWFVQIALHIEQKGWSISAGRFDQYMFPFYKKDIDAGIAQDDLYELLLSLWVKFMENVDQGLKMTTFQNLTLGGKDESGQCMSNPLSHLCLDATAQTGFIQPALSVRWHENVSRSFWEHTMQVISTGMGMPALFNDNIIIDALVYNGVLRSDALNYGVVGCVEAAVSGKMQGLTAGGHVNLAKALELALFDGRSLTSGEQIGLKTGDASKFANFEELFEAYSKQSRWLSGINVTAAQIAGDVQKILGHCPFCSSLLDNCLSTQRDLVKGGTQYSLSGVAILGAANAVDGLNAIDKLVFKRKLFTMGEVLTALEADFNGYEPMRLAFLNHKDRFGNDIDEVDNLANRINSIHADFFRSHPDPRGGHYTCGIWPVNGHVYSGHHTGAAPDGRHSGTPLADGAGACQGADKCGPTALLKSVAKLNNVEHWAAGSTCNIKFPRSLINNKPGLANMSDIVEAFMILGGQELQINVVDADVLRAAQQKPEDYANLIIRVAGYSAYFTTLESEVQNEVISRTEQMV